MIGYLGFCLFLLASSLHADELKCPQTETDKNTLTEKLKDATKAKKCSEAINTFRTLYLCLQQQLDYDGKKTLIGKNGKASGSEEKATEPPGRYSEAGLVKELEKRGIGRPSTYASIIKTIEERGYVEKENKSLKPTDTGEVVSTFLEDNFMHYINDSFTAEMEDSLDDIALGKKEYESTLRKFYIPFHKEIKEKEKTAKITTLGDADAKYKCPKCEGSMVVKLGRGGKFLSCAKYPDCEGALMIDGTEIKKDEPIGIDPTTNLPIYVLVGRFGPYVQLGEKPKKKSKGEKPRMASIPKGMDLSKVTVENALKYLSLPRILGSDPKSGKEIKANIGRFGPYIMLDGDFRSIKEKDGDNPYDITLERALEILSKPKAIRKGRFAKKEIATENTNK